MYFMEFAKSSEKLTDPTHLLMVSLYFHHVRVLLFLGFPLFILFLGDQQFSLLPHIFIHPFFTPQYT
jgi:hypothetical protein